MRTDFPPISASPPLIRKRRRQGTPPITPPAIPAAVRREIAQRIHGQIRAVQTRLNELTPEQKRSVFLKLKSDREITKEDLAGTGLMLIAQSGTNESLVIPKRTADIGKFESRITAFGEGDQPGRPPGTELATTIRGVEIGDPTDRLSEALAANYAQLINEPFVKYEIELTSFKQRPHAQREVESFVSEIRQAVGAHGAVYEHEVRGRGARVLVGTTGSKLREFVEASEWMRKITFLDARPKFETFHEVYSNFNIANVNISQPDAGAETICVIDTGISGLNPFLQNVVRREISRSFIPGFNPLEDEDGHGSGVASLAAFYAFDLASGATNSAGAWIASARITTDAGQLDYPQTDNVEMDRQREARMLSTLLREIVVTYAPQGVKIFILAFQILGQIWSRATRRLVPRNAWLARTIDQLSREHDIIFVTITGNLSPLEIGELVQHQPYPQYLSHPLAKVHDPGQSALSISVGSIAHSATVVASPHQAMAIVDQPSPFTRAGPGFGDAVKPDVVERGGNYVFDTMLGRPVANAGTNVLMASRRLTPALQQNVGTSFAAPRVAYHLSQICRDLRRIGVEPTGPLLRAFLVSSAEVPPETAIVGSNIDRFVSGYGIPNGSAATDCSGNSVLLYWQGNLTVDYNAIFRIHVPAELSGVGRGRKRIVVAVASAPPVQEWGVAEYLGAETKFRLYRGDRDYSRIEANLQRDENEPNRAVPATEADMTGSPGLTDRSVGTLQRASFEWSDHDPNYSATDYTLAISLSGASWTPENTSVPIGVVVRIEDATGRFQELYSMVQASVRARVRT